MPEFKDKERIPNPTYFANVSICVLQDNIPFLIYHPSQVLNTIDYGCLIRLYITKLPSKEIVPEYRDIE